MITCLGVLLGMDFNMMSADDLPADDEESFTPPESSNSQPSKSSKDSNQSHKTDSQNKPDLSDESKKVTF